MIVSDTGNCFLLLSSIFFPQEQLGPGISRPLFFISRTRAGEVDHG